MSMRHPWHEASPVSAGLALTQGAPEGDRLARRRLVSRLCPRPEGNGCAERFNRILKENLLWVRTVRSVEGLRPALTEFRQTYDGHWLIERHGHRSPAQLRRDQMDAMPLAASSQSRASRWGVQAPPGSPGRRCPRGRKRRWPAREPVRATSAKAGHPRAGGPCRARPEARPPGLQEGSRCAASAPPPLRCLLPNGSGKGAGPIHPVTRTARAQVRRHGKQWLR